MRFAHAEQRCEGARGCHVARRVTRCRWRSSAKVLAVDLSCRCWKPPSNVRPPKARTSAAFVLAPMDAPAVNDSVDPSSLTAWSLAARGGSGSGRGRARGEAGSGPVRLHSRNTFAPTSNLPGGRSSSRVLRSAPVLLTETQLIQELGDAGFVPDAAVPLVEHNRPRPGSVSAGNVPVVYEATFRYQG
jgi:hypothetical protein